ncbi:oocyte zinc finger protein XlCOF22-like [Cottoperca gobio]|uniref:Oocyte zinc finger protein XlCOF22-like n=1 Tax=Cottoperca gobio TaxID=56716 RepID=A0A6J2QJ48_COTGO|nr:oocyte zinc finger protein XlCOF22-like [Cottoperca gobio]XP_029298424.1 oocyte zinc finger protein XlCOF22-like [Cottoperca gobio]XP_029298425.1 oocyte zinc finger protein XlCOF22-like [Cottoperca gobio]
MEMLKIEQVIVGNERRSTSAEIKSEPVVAPLQSYQHESLQCFQCFITFTNSKAKERHMRKSHRDQYKQHLQQTDTVFTCYKCDKSYSFSEELSQHQATHSTEEKPFLCAYCQKNFFTFTELNKHRRHECIERRCPCRDCGALFPSPSRLRNHRMAVHPQRPIVADDINTYQCCKCSCGFRTEEELLQHQEKFANDINCDVKPQGKKRGRKPKNAAQGGIVESKKIKQEGAVECKEDNDSTTEGSPSNELQPELKIPCSEANCDFIFPSVAALRAHKREAHGPPPSNARTCTECDESYAGPEQLKAHMAKDHHSGYTCPTCGTCFAGESTHTEGEEAAEKR